MSQLCSLGEKNYFVHIHILMKIFENLKVMIPLKARIGKQNVHGNKVYSGMERQKNVYPSLQIVLPTSQQTPLSKFVIWFMTC